MKALLTTRWQSKRPYLIGPVFFQRLNAAIADEYDFSIPVEVSVLLISDTAMQSLNQQTAGNNYITDVLSFSFIEDEDIQQCVEQYRGEGILLGEIVICYTQAQRQAQAKGHSLRAELAVLYVHGILHVLGYDHATKKKRVTMKQLEATILQRAGYSQQLL